MPALPALGRARPNTAVVEKFLPRTPPSRCFLVGHGRSRYKIRPDGNPLGGRMKRTNTLSNAVAFAALAALALGYMFVASRTHVPSAAPRAAAQQQGNEFRWREALAAGKVIEIKGVNGNVEATPSSSGEVEVVAVKSARRSNPEDVRIEVVRHSEGVTICAVYPNVDGCRANTCEPGSGGHINTRNNDTEVSFTVRIPS